MISDWHLLCSYDLRGFRRCDWVKVKERMIFGKQSLLVVALRVRVCHQTGRRRSRDCANRDADLGTFCAYPSFIPSLYAVGGQALPDSNRMTQTAPSLLMCDRHNSLIASKSQAYKMPGNLARVYLYGLHSTFPSATSAYAST
jgi:hypothetical protein